MKILLDANFVITCAKQKIDFETIANELIDGYLVWLVPKEVLEEINNLSDKDLLKLSLEILQHLDPKIIELPGKNPNVDEKISRYIKGEEIILATLDKGLCDRVSNQILTIKGKKSLALI